MAWCRRENHNAPPHQVSLNTYLIFFLCITSAAQQEEEGGHGGHRSGGNTESVSKSHPKTLLKLGRIHSFLSPPNSSMGYGHAYDHHLQCWDTAAELLWEAVMGSVFMKMTFSFPNFTQR